MSQSHKKIVWVLASFIVAGLLLVGAVAALASAPFSLIGTLEFTDPVYSVNSQPITVTETTVCPLLEGGNAEPCSLLAGRLVEATGTYSGTVYTATVIAELGDYTGVLTAITAGDPNIWTVGSMEFEVSAALAGSFAVRDVVMVTFKNISGTYVAVAVDPVETSTFVGKVVAIGDDIWTINDQNFNIDGDTAIYTDPEVDDIVMVIYYGENIAVNIEEYPTTTVIARVLGVEPWMIDGLDGLTTNEWTEAYEGAVPGDLAKVVYYEFEGVMIASEITLYAPFKNENARCEDWMAEDFKIPPGIEKQLPEDVDLAQVYAMFCQGFGWGEIKNALRLANDDYSTEELMAMKAKGTGWGVLKNELGLKPEKENNGKGHENEETSKPVKPEETGKPDEPGKPEKSDNPNKPENPGNSDHTKDKTNNGKNK